MEKRYGRQTPTSSFIIEYTESKGKEAIDLYNKSGRTAFPWQELMIYDIMAVNCDGLWTHSKFGYSVSCSSGRACTDCDISGDSKGGLWEP